jgi:ketosteroid isomerase-like protein
MVEAVNKNDIDALLGHLDKTVVVTWMDGQVSRGPQGVKQYIEKMTKGENRKVNSYKTEAEVDELTQLFGETGVATGHSKDQFVLTDGRDLVVSTRWTATLAKKDGKWKVAGFHASTDMFDNPVLHIAVRRTALWTGGIAAAAGLVLGTLAAWLLRRRKQAG